MKQELNDKLNLLIARNYDAEKGFKEAMEDVNDEMLKQYFNINASQRYDFGHELKEEIKKENGEIEKGSTLLGDAHRAWMDVKSMIAGNDTEAILEECKRGEEKAINDYEEVLSETELTPSARKVVQQQREQITNNIVHIDNMLERINS